jgi:protein-S-isoprenylcysteine O-methyltransferase Ste14
LAKRVFVFVFGVVVYLFFLAIVVYAIGFVGNIFVPKDINDGSVSSAVVAVLVDVLLVALFGLQHTVMSRLAFKKRWKRLIPDPLERSLFVLAASLALTLLFWQWRPVAGYVWNFTAGFMHTVLTGLFWLGWLGVVLSTFLIDHFDLFGLRQVYLYLRGINYTPVPLKQSTVYRYVRHPLMLSFLIAFWATPRLSVSHFLFAAGMTIYIFVGIAFEERGLARQYGADYKRYREQVSMLVPLPRRK